MPDPDLTSHENHVRTMSDAELRDAYDKAEAETEEADLLAGEMERRNLDD